MMRNEICRYSVESVVSYATVLYYTVRGEMRAVVVSRFAVTFFVRSFAHK